MDCSPQGSSVHGILQATILQCTAISFYRGSSWPRDQTRVSCTAGRYFTMESPEKPGVFLLQVHSQRRGHIKGWISEDHLEFYLPHTWSHLENESHDENWGAKKTPAIQRHKKNKRKCYLSVSEKCKIISSKFWCFVNLCVCVCVYTHTHTHIYIHINVIDSQGQWFAIKRTLCPFDNFLGVYS